MFQRSKISVKSKKLLYGLCKFFALARLYFFTHISYTFTIEEKISLMRCLRLLTGCRT